MPADRNAEDPYDHCWSLPELPQVAEVHELGRRWAPYRTYAAALLWASLQPADEKLAAGSRPGRGLSQPGSDHHAAGQRAAAAASSGGIPGARSTPGVSPRATAAGAVSRVTPAAV